MDLEISNLEFEISAIPYMESLISLISQLRLVKSRSAVAGPLPQLATTSRARAQKLRPRCLGVIRTANMQRTGSSGLIPRIFYIDGPLAGLLASCLKSGDSASFVFAMLVVDDELNSLIS
jgi:hypothetical protein